MVTSLHVRNLDQRLVARLKRRAASNNRSVEAEHRAILSEALGPDLDPDFEQRLAEFRSRTSDRQHTPSEVLQQMSRDEAR